MPLDRSETHQDASESQVKAFERLASQNASGLAQTSANGKSRGDQRDVFAVWQAEKSALLRYALGILRNADDAADAVNSTLDRALDIQAAPPQNWGSWMQTVTRNLALTALRIRQRVVSVDSTEIMHLMETKGDALSEILAGEVKRIAVTRDEKALIVAILSSNNAQDAALQMGVSRTWFYRVIRGMRQKLGIVETRALSARERWAALQRATEYWAHASSGSGCRYGSRSSVSSVPVAEQDLRDYAYGYDWMADAVASAFAELRSTPASWYAARQAEIDLESQMRQASPRPERRWMPLIKRTVFTGRIDVSWR